MFIDASAIVAILASEDDAADLTRRLGGAGRRLTSALAVYEAATGLARRKNRPVGQARDVVQAFLAKADITTVPLGDAERDAALEAFERFGKGRHPAQLNMGDCFAYACARTNGVPLLFKGDDFAKTDIAVG